MSDVTNTFIVNRKFDGGGAVRFPGELLDGSDWPQSRASQLIEARYIRPYYEDAPGISDVHGRQYASPEAKMAAQEQPEYGPVDHNRTLPEPESGTPTRVDENDPGKLLPQEDDLEVEDDEGDEETTEEDEDEEYNPSEHSIKDVVAYIEENDLELGDIIHLHEQETEGRNRAGLLEKLNTMIEALSEEIEEDDEDGEETTEEDEDGEVEDDDTESEEDEDEEDEE